MLTYFTDVISFYAETLSKFLMREPICYIMVAVISLFVIRIILAFKRM